LRFNWLAGHRSMQKMIKFVVKPTDRGWAIYQEGAFLGEYPTRRGAMNAQLD
jgi:hypothetical protein